MKGITIKEMQELVEFQRNVHGTVYVLNVNGSIYGNVFGDVKGHVAGKINGRNWNYIETPKEKAIRLIREGKGAEAIGVLEEFE